MDPRLSQLVNELYALFLSTETSNHPILAKVRTGPGQSLAAVTDGLFRAIASGATDQGHVDGGPSATMSYLASGALPFRWLNWRCGREERPGSEPVLRWAAAEAMSQLLVQTGEDALAAHVRQQLDEVDEAVRQSFLSLLSLAIPPLSTARDAMTFFTSGTRALKTFGRQAAPMTPGDHGSSREAHLRRLLARTLEEVAQPGQPLVIVVEDCHMIDRFSADVLTSFLQFLPLPVLVIFGIEERATRSGAFSRIQRHVESAAGCSIAEIDADELVDPSRQNQLLDEFGGSTILPAAAVQGEFVHLGVLREMVGLTDDQFLGELHRLVHRGLLRPMSPGLAAFPNSQVATAVVGRLDAPALSRLREQQVRALRLIWSEQSDAQADLLTFRTLVRQAALVLQESDCVRLMIALERLYSGHDNARSLSRPFLEFGDSVSDEVLASTAQFRNSLGYAALQEGSITSLMKEVEATITRLESALTRSEVEKGLAPGAIAWELSEAYRLKGLILLAQVRPDLALPAFERAIALRRGSDHGVRPVQYDELFCRFELRQYERGFSEGDRLLSSLLLVPERDAATLPIKVGNCLLGHLRHRATSADQQLVQYNEIVSKLEGFRWPPDLALSAEAARLQLVAHHPDHRGEAATLQAYADLVERTEDHHGEDAHETLQLRSAAAEVLFDWGYHREALQQYRLIMDRSIRQSGRSDFDSVKRISNYATALIRASQVSDEARRQALEEAEPLLAETVHGFGPYGEFGRDHLLTDIHNLGMTQLSLGRANEAVGTLTVALELRTRAWGPTNPRTIATAEELNEARRRL